VRLRNKSLLFVLMLVLMANTGFGQSLVQITGKTMGTSYHITYFDERARNFKSSIDSLLLVVNQSINNYDPASEVSKFNKDEHGIAFRLPYLLPPLTKAAEVYKASNRAFDVTVMPLVNVWGFGPGKRLDPDSATIDSIKAFVGFDKLQLNNNGVSKLDPRTQIDFGGIGQGYGADVITDFLKSKGINNMLVELGGEGMACGKNLKTGKAWEIGILDPGSTINNQFFKAFVSLTDRSFTTSGNYFNYYEVNGKRYSHTIDPKTGYPAQRAILSASVFSKDCTTADAWATAFMVMGHEEAIVLLKSHHELDALLIYTSPTGKVETFTTPGISKFIRFDSNQSN
jgi:thiamine biosynthesis lipoprotein